MSKWIIRKRNQVRGARLANLGPMEVTQIDWRLGVKDLAMAIAAVHSTVTPARAVSHLVQAEQASHEGFFEEGPVTSRGDRAGSIGGEFTDA